MTVHRVCLILILLAATTTACSREPAASNAPAAGGSSEGADWQVTVQPLELPAGPGTSEPQLTSSDRGAILSWIEQQGNMSTLRFVERTGDRWSTPRTVVAGDNWFRSWADVPMVMRMRDGTLVANFYPATDPLVEAYDLRLTYSRDDGQTWSRPVAPHHDTTKTQHGFASLVELPDRQLGVIWLDGRDQELNTTDREGGSMAMYFARFDQQWKQLEESPVNTRVCECCQTSAAVTSSGVLAAFRDRSPREIRDIHATRLENGKWTPARPVHVDNWEIDACPVNGPALSARGEQVAAAWFTAKDEKSQAYVAFSKDGGRSWANPVRLDDEATLGHVDVELLDDGSAVATWMEFAQQRAWLRMRRIEPGGARSRAVDLTPVRVTGYPRLARHGSELLAVWTETGEGNDAAQQRVRGARVRLPGL